MESETHGSVTHWIGGLAGGDSVAAQGLWNRYFARLVVVAETRLKSLNRESSGEDVALSALKSVMLGVQNNRYPNLTDRDGLWPLLVTLTARKAIDEVRRQLAERRDDAKTEPLGELRAVLSAEPTPEFAVEVADEMERLIRKCHDKRLRTVVQRKLENCTNEEIAAELGCHRRTVIRKLNLVRQEWEAASSKE